MTLQIKTLTAGLLAAALPSVAAAQVVSQPAQARPGQVVPGQPGQAVQAQTAQAAANPAADNQRQVQRTIAHALNMAVCGSELQLAARSARGGRSQNDGREQNADNNRNGGNDQNADNNRNRGGNDGGNAGWQQAHQQAVQQLQQQAWHQFEGSDRLLQAASADIQNDERNAANRGGADQAAWSRRFHNAANRYTNSLRNLTGARNRPAGSPGGQADQDQADNDNQRRGRRNLNRTEVAQVTLINHAVSEALHAFQLSTAGNAGQPGAQGTAYQQLQAHARHMADESQQLLQAVTANIEGQNGADNRGDDRQRDTNRNDNNANANSNVNANAGNANAANANASNQNTGNANADDAHGAPTVQSLAQQARNLIDTLQRLNAGEQAR